MVNRWPIRACWQRGLFLLAVLLAGRELCFSRTTVTNYVIRVWQAENGLPQNSVTAVAQTIDGYIWIGTYSALARFDGIRFTIFDSSTPGMRSSRVTSLFEAKDRTLWIGDEDGVLTRFKSGRFESVDFQARWSDRSIFHIGADDDGKIWLASREGMLTRLDDGLTYPPEAGRTMGLPNVVTSPQGLWVARNNKVFSLQQAKLVHLDFDGLPEGNYIQGICPADDGGIWVANNGRVRKWDGTKWTKDPGATPWGMSPLATMIETRSGRLVAGTQDHGLFVLSAQGEALHFSRANGLPSDWVTSVIEDREGNLWVGTRGGLAMLHPTSVATVTPPDRWQGFPVLSVAAGSGDEIWAATEGAGLYRYQSGQWRHYGQEAGLSNLFVWSVSRDASNHIWAGTWGNGVFIQQGDSFAHPSGLDASLQALAIFHEADGTSWVGTSEGLLRCRSGKVEWLVQAPQMISPDIRCIARSTQGVLWFGSFGGGLGCLDGNQFRQFRKSDGLPSDFIQCLWPADDGSLWAGTFGGGLVRLKQGHFSVIARNQGLPSNDIGHIEEDGQGFFWISSHAGILRVRKADLLRCADGLSSDIHCQCFAISDGLPTVECAGGLQPAGCRTRDGRLWFPTSEGLVTIDPGNVWTNAVLPPVIIEKLLIDDRVVAENFDGSLRPQIPPGRHRVEVQYTGLSYIAPERVRFQYRLKGLDADWISAGTARAVNYNYLPPGSYLFEVMACNNDALWNWNSARVAFVVLPYFWQTSWFRILGAILALAAVGGVAWLDARRRLRRKLERLERQQAIEQERARIAHDIHDDLGAYLTRITMLCDPARTETRSAPPPVASMNQIYGTARELTQAMDEIVWAVNPRHDTLDSLTNYLHRFALEFLENAGVRSRLDMPYQLPAWPLSAETRHNLFLAFKETLNNVVRHALASEVHIVLALEPAGFRLIIEDDGCGFAGTSALAGSDQNPAVVSGGNGLRNVRRRLVQIGGQCEILSDPGRGTRVQFFVPAQGLPLTNGNGLNHSNRS